MSLFYRALWVFLLTLTTLVAVDQVIGNNKSLVAILVPFLDSLFSIFQAIAIFGIWLFVVEQIAERSKKKIVSATIAVTL